MASQDLESLRAIDVAAQIADPQAYDLAHKAIVLLETCVTHLENVGE